MAALWLVPGVGTVTIAEVIERAGPLADLLERPVRSWLNQVQWTPAARDHLLRVDHLARLADGLERALPRVGYELAFADDPAYPARLRQVPDAPPLLFVLGPGGRATPRRRVGMVGTRKPESGFLRHAQAFARAIGGSGVCVISGAAEGVDQACHRGALEVGAETWAFLGCSIDQMDDQQAVLIPSFRDGGATFFTEFPPGVRSSKQTFPRRNRLISGAADAVLMLRGDKGSGAMHTVRYALEQGRPVLAMPGDFFNVAASGCNQVLRDGRAAICLEPADLLRAAGVTGQLSTPPPPSAPRTEPSPAAAAILSALAAVDEDFDSILGRLPKVSSGALAAALIELELTGHVAQKPGRLYSRVL